MSSSSYSPNVNFDKTVTIPAADQTSSGVDLLGSKCVGLMIPSPFTSIAVDFDGSADGAIKLLERILVAAHPLGGGESGGSSCRSMHIFSLAR